MPTVRTRAVQGSTQTLLLPQIVQRQAKRMRLRCCQAAAAAARLAVVIVVFSSPPALTCLCIPPTTAQLCRQLVVSLLISSACQPRQQPTATHIAHTCTRPAHCTVLPATCQVRQTRPSILPTVAGANTRSRPCRHHVKGCTDVDQPAQHSTPLCDMSQAQAVQPPPSAELLALTAHHSIRNSSSRQCTCYSSSRQCWTSGLPSAQRPCAAQCEKNRMATGAQVQVGCASGASDRTCCCPGRNF